MKKLLCLVPLLLALSGCGSAQIIGVGNRHTFTPVQNLSFDPSPGVYGSSQGVDIDLVSPVRLCALVCVTTDGTLPTASGLFTTGATCTGTSTNTLNLTVSSTETITATAFPATHSGTPCPYIYGTSQPIVGVYVISSTGFVDNFPYSDGNLNSVSGGNWTNDSTASIQLYVSSNIVAGSASINCPGGDVCFTRWTGSGGPAPANQSTQVTFTGISSEFLGPAVRVDTGGASTGYAALCGFNPDFSADTCQLLKIVAGTATLLENPGITVSSTATVKLTASGTSSTVLTVYVNGSTYTTYTDSSSPITSGDWGLGDGPGGVGDTHISQAVGTTP